MLLLELIELHFPSLVAFGQFGIEKVLGLGLLLFLNVTFYFLYFLLMGVEEKCIFDLVVLCSSESGPQPNDLFVKVDVILLQILYFSMVEVDI